MFRVRCLTLGAVIFAMAFPAMAADSKTAAKEKEQKLIEVLRSDAPPPTKAITCKQLAVYGGKDAVPALAALLPNAELSSWARIALEVIPDSSADDALREATGKVQGRLLVGVINSIGVRRDAKAVETLVPRLKDADAEVASAAAAALGRIGSQAAASALEQAIPGSPPAVRSAVAQGCVLCAEKCLADGKQAEAVRLYDVVRKADVPKPRVIEATRGAILARQGAGLPLLVEQLRSGDKDRFAIGLRTARELGGAEVAKALVEELERMQPPAQQHQPPKVVSIVKAQYGAGEQRVDVTDQVAAAVRNNELAVEASNSLAGDPAPGLVKELRLTYKIGGVEKTVVVPEGESIRLGEPVPEGNPRQVRLIQALGDLGQAAALPAVLKAAKSGSWGARMAAVGVLRRLGDDSCVPVLLDLAAESDSGLSRTAVEVLAEVPGKDVDDAIAARLLKAEGKARAALIQLVGQRHTGAAVPGLLKAVDDPDPQVRLAVLAALGATVELRDLPVLVARLANPKSPEEEKVAETALRAACARMADREACAEKLVAAMSQATVPVKCKFLGVLGATGGAKALQAVSAAAKDTNPEIQDAGSRLLGEWMTPDAAPVLLDLAKNAADARYKGRALRGYLRIARQMALLPADRIAMCREALKLCQRDDERKLVVQALGRAGTGEALSLVVPHLRTPALRADAAASAVAIAQKLLQSNPAAVADAMKQVLEAGGAEAKTTDRAKTLLEQATKASGKK